MQETDIIIGTTVVRRTAFALNHFMENQRAIQDIYPQSKLVMATDESDFENELKEFLKAYKVEGKVIVYKTEKPEYSESRDWNITAGHEAMRKYILETDAKYLLWIDADMTVDPKIISVMKKEIEGYDVVQSAYQDRSDTKYRWNVIGFGIGCSFIRRSVLEKIGFKCYELKHQKCKPLDDEMAFERELFKMRAKIKKGAFVQIHHYSADGGIVTTNPQSLTLLQKIKGASLFRYIVIMSCLILGKDLNVLLRPLLYRVVCFKQRIKSGIFYGNAKHS